MILKSASGQEYDITIGLEIHAQIKTDKKLFSQSRANWKDEPNANISHFDIALPGTLQVLNTEAVKPVIKAGIAINATINEVSYFDRKHYFYPDLPSGYQITQMYRPIITDGSITIQTEQNKEKTIRINRIHIEQDAGKSIHDAYQDATAIDYNRSGIALMEIVSEPDIKSAFEACEYVKKIQSLMRSVGASDADMEKGSMRIDVNISVKKTNETKLGNRVELKNLNSLRNLTLAVEYEANLHIKMIENNEKIITETKLFNVEKGQTISMRKKEDASDYKYFPDPDLLPLKISKEYIEEVRKNMPQLPHQKYERYIEYGIVAKEAKIISDDVYLSNYFDEVANVHDPKQAYTFVVVELLGRLNNQQIKIDDSKILPSHIISLLDLIKSGKINGKIAKTVMDIMFENSLNNKDISPAEIVKENQLEQNDNSEEIIEAIHSVIKDNPAQLDGFKNGNQKLFGFFVGQVMKITNGKANPSKVNELLKTELEKLCK